MYDIKQKKIPIYRSLLVYKISLTLLIFYSSSSYLFSQSIEEELLIKEFRHALNHYSNLSFINKNFEPDSIVLMNLINEDFQEPDLLKEFKNIKFVTNLNSTFPLKELCQIKGLKWLEVMTEQPLPNCLINLKRLGFLAYIHPNIKEVPDIIMELKELKFLYLALNIKKEKAGLNKLEALEALISLSLVIPNIRYFPKEVCQLKELRELMLDYNRNLDLPIALSQMKNLRKLYLGSLDIGNYNNIKILKNLKSLRELEIVIKKTKLIPDDIGELTFLKKLIIRGNHLDLNQKHRIKKLLPNVKVVFSNF